MLIIEYIMMLVLFATCVYVTMTDIKSGIIQNKIIIVSAVIGAILNIIYYAVFCQSYFICFVFNLIVIILISIAFYAFHFWTAGDSKLLMLVVFILPAGIYYNGDNFSATIIIMIIIFSIAFCYTVIESIVLGIKNKNLFEFGHIRLEIKSLVIQYIKCSSIITIVNIILNVFVSDFYQTNKPLIMVLNMLLVYAICYVRFFDKLVPLIILASSSLALFFYIYGFSGSIHFNYLTYFYTIIVLFLRLLSEKYNYKEINTDDIKPGMILSFSSVMMFQSSRIQGLPHTTTEDTRSRLSASETDSIKKWATSAKGSPTIIILRKIPFAVFITAGTVLFFIYGMFIK